MAFLKKAAPAAPSTEPFRAPKLAEVSPDLARLVERHHELNVELAALRAEADTLRTALKKEPRALSAEVAILLGDEVGEAEADPKPRLKEIATREHHITEALYILPRRIAEEQDKASPLVCAAVKGEFFRRMRAVVDALKAAADARRSYQALVDDLVNDDVKFRGIQGIAFTWMGDLRDGHVERMVKDAVEAGAYD